MKNTLISIFTLLLSTQSFAQVDMSYQERIQQQREQSRQENKRIEESLKPNERSNPTQFNTDSLNIDPDLQFEITNHLLGYSMIMEDDKTLNGIKITGIVNFAYYNVKEKKESDKRNKGRLVFGLEFPIIDISDRSGMFMGLGGSLGDSTGFYGDIGVDFFVFKWFKVQGGLNYNSDAGVGTMINAGLSW